MNICIWDQYAIFDSTYFRKWHFNIDFIVCEIIICRRRKNRIKNIGKVDTVVQNEILTINNGIDFIFGKNGIETKTETNITI